MQMNTIPTISPSTKKLFMWYKVKNLKSKKLTNSQVGKKLGIHRTTVSEYLSMTEEEFRHSQSYQRDYPLLLDIYEDDVKLLLDDCSDFSTSQIHDRLKESFPDLPQVNEKTVYNFVMKIRDKYNLPKESSERWFQKCEETPYGEYAQVDFGERYVRDSNKVYKKVYFFAIVLSRSRAKFIFFSTTPFNSELAVYAHELAFQYLGGVPKKIIYDQDKLFIVKENFGDYILTNVFDAYVSHSPFMPIFCHKEDPQSKGKCENVIKYVKNNFLKGRLFIDIDTLNTQALGWLSRTGNGKMHAGTRKIPAEVLLIEQDYLLPYNGKPMMPSLQMEKYTVRIDNTINFRGCFYSVPTKTYINKKTCCFVEVKNDAMLIYNHDTGKLIASHKVSKEKGNFVAQPGHQIVNQYKYPELEQKVYKQIGADDYIRQYFASMRKDRPRHYCGALRHILKNIERYDASLVRDTLLELAIEQIYNPQILLDCIQTKQLRKYGKPSDLDNYPEQAGSINNYAINVDKSDINVYNSIMS